MASELPRSLSDGAEGLGHRKLWHVNTAYQVNLGVNMMKVVWHFWHIWSRSHIEIILRKYFINIFHACPETRQTVWTRPTVSSCWQLAWKLLVNRLYVTIVRSWVTESLSLLAQDWLSPFSMECASQPPNSQAVISCHRSLLSADNRASVIRNSWTQMESWAMLLQ